VARTYAHVFLRWTWQARVVNKAFTKDDGERDPLLVPPRPPLPAGSPNYVTLRGLDALRAELRELEQARDELLAAPRDDEQLRSLAVLSGRLRELEERIAGALVVDVRAQPLDEVRFGARVTVQTSSGERHYEIVGVDEANAGAGKIAFTAPLARALFGKRVGELATLYTPRGDEELQVLVIEYD
jgi:transcription elongation factor GreB